MKQLSKESVNLLEVSAEESGQRIDNYLIRWLKGVPKSHVYRILRSGEVRVNKGRVGPDYRLEAGDKVRVPPVRTAAPAADAPSALHATTLLVEDLDAMALAAGLVEQELDRASVVVESPQGEASRQGEAPRGPCGPPQSHAVLP